MSEAREIRCLYGGGEWSPMGRSRTRCPLCGAVITPDTHPIRAAEPTETEARDG